MKAIVGTMALIFLQMWPSIAYTQEEPNRKPIVFIWVQDIQSGNRDALGTGFLLGENGTILTARHIVKDDRVVPGTELVVSVSSKGGPPVAVDMRDVDCAPTADFCFIRIQRDSIDDIDDFFSLGCYIPQPGEAIIAAGFFAADDLSAGVVTPRGHMIGTEIGGGLLPTDIAMEPGMSGGPVFDSNGVVIGIVKGGSTQFAYIQPLQRASSYLSNRGLGCFRDSDEVVAVEAEPAEPEPSSESKVTFNTVSYLLCQGEHYSRCPAGSIHLGCSVSAESWAEQNCAEREVVRTQTFGGNQCGYGISTVQCTNPVNPG